MYILDILWHVSTMITKRTNDGSFELVLDSRDHDIRPTKFMKAVSARAIYLSNDYECGKKVWPSKVSGRGAGNIFGLGVPTVTAIMTEYRAELVAL